MWRHQFTSIASIGTKFYLNGATKFGGRYVLKRDSNTIYVTEEDCRRKFDDFFFLIIHFTSKSSCDKIVLSQFFKAMIDLYYNF